MAARQLCAPAALATLRRTAALVSRWRARARERRQLATLDDRLLADIRITRLEVARMCEALLARLTRRPCQAKTAAAGA